MTTAQNILTIARKYIGTTEANGGHKKIIDAYNAHKPLAVGYKVKYNDDWCDTFVSKVAIEAGAVGLIGTECGVERHIAIFKKLGIWNEDGRIVPKPGDIITYNWGDTTQSNDGFADHIGFVESVSGGTITTIEGNYGNAVKRRTVSVGTGTIRGYARPKYSNSTATKPVTTKPTQSNIKTIKVGTRAKQWETRENIPSFVIGQTFDVLQEKSVNQSKSKKAYLLGKGTVATGWLLEQDVDGFKATSTPAAATLATKKYNLTTKVLKRTTPQMSGSEVLTLQQALSSIYYYPDKGAKNNGCDGYFGAKTEDAVKRFQSAYGLQIDGKFGPATRAKLDSLVNK